MGSVTNQQLIMEEVLARFPHLGENIFQKLNSESLINCKEVNRTFKNFMKVEKSSYLRAIEWFTNCSEPLMRKIVKKSGAAIIILSILREIFGNFIRGTKQNSKYLQYLLNTPLHLAADRGQLGAYQLIMENVDNKNPINSITDEMRWKYMKRRDVYELGSHGITPLHLAAKNGHLSVCKLIIENVFDKNPSGGKMVTKSWMHPVWIDQWTPLHLAAYAGHFSVCELIINNVMEKNPGDQTGWTPLHSAAQNGHLTVCKLILNNIRASYVCNLYTKDKFGNTPLKLATQYQNEDIRLEILKFLSDTKVRNSTYLKDHQNKNRVDKEEDEDKDLYVQEEDIDEDTEENKDLEIQKAAQEDKKGLAPGPSLPQGPTCPRQKRAKPEEVSRPKKAICLRAKSCPNVDFNSENNRLASLDELITFDTLSRVSLFSFDNICHEQMQ